LQSASDWIAAFCEEIDMSQPSPEEQDAILRLAAVAAHSSERIAAPIACYVAGRSGKPLGELKDVAEALASGG
jgi:Domain of unknown function (DUF6457)